MSRGVLAILDSLFDTTFSLPVHSVFTDFLASLLLGYGSLVDFCGSRILAAVCLCCNANAGMGDSACEPDSSLISTLSVSPTIPVEDDMKKRRYERPAMAIPFEKSEVSTSETGEALASIMFGCNLDYETKLLRRPRS